MKKRGTENGAGWERDRKAIMLRGGEEIDMRME
jgi:hypothetical protein